MEWHSREDEGRAAQRRRSEHAHVLASPTRVPPPPPPLCPCRRHRRSPHPSPHHLPLPPCLQGHQPRLDLLVSAQRHGGHDQVTCHLCIPLRYRHWRQHHQRLHALVSRSCQVPGCRRALALRWCVRAVGWRGGRGPTRWQPNTHGNRRGRSLRKPVPPGACRRAAARLPVRRAHSLAAAFLLLSSFSLQLPAGQLQHHRLQPLPQEPQGGEASQQRALPAVLADLATGGPDQVSGWSGGWLEGRPW